MRVIPSILIAFSTYSRLPIPQTEWSDQNRRYAMCFFPLVGAVIGGLLWLWLYACDAFGLGGLIRGAVGAVIPLAVTGGIHMDGFMDTSDALASWQPMEKRLEILKDSHAGAFAVMGCVCYMLVMAALLSETPARAGIRLGICYTVSRAMSAWTLTVFPSARPKGMLDQFAAAAQKKAVTVSSLVYVLAALGIWFLNGWVHAAAGVLAVLSVTVYYRHMAVKNFGGVTGDLAGWYLQMLEICMIAAIMIGGRLA